MLVLTVIEGPSKGKRFELPADEPQMLGRSSEALPLGDQAVSRRHAELTPDRGEWYLRDLESQNGTLVNGNAISDRVRLQTGDTITVGQTTLAFGRTSIVDELDMIELLKPGEVATSVDATLKREGVTSPAEPAHNGRGATEAERHALDHLRVIYQITELAAKSFTRGALLHGLLELVFEEFQPERGVVMLIDEDGKLAPGAVKNRALIKGREDDRIQVSRTILLHAMRTGEAVLSTNAMADPRFSSGDSVHNLRIRSAVCVPVEHRATVFGAIYIDTSASDQTFDNEQLQLLHAVGQQAGIALSNLQLNQGKLQTERLAAMGETVASLSHSVKNILQGLSGGADLVEMGLDREDLEISRQGWSILRRNLDRIADLTTNMLAFSRQRQVEMAFAPLRPLVEDCAQLLESVCEQAGVALIVDAEDDVPPVPIDPPLIHQAVMNLLTNALEAVPREHGTITARIHYEEPDSRGPGSPGEAHIMVIDNGPGIPKERQASIFEPFQTSKGLKGTGLGLAVTKRIVEDHRGRIKLSSEPGKGSTFTMVLPADPGRPMDPAATRGPGHTSP
ncbi:MAG: FHA domain-containing protein [Phycisphaerales bacterium]|nr:FHA domain-containing protein [Phycisphaerales bacterium]